jgi:hypothetical protein
MSTSTLLSPGLIATKPYPILGGSQHLCLIRHSGSQRLSNPFMLDWQQLGNTVLASAFVKGAEVALPVPLEPPFDRLVLPPLTLDQLQPRLAKDQHGRVIGMLLSVPGLFVHANNILSHATQCNPRYKYRQAVGLMALEAARLLASVLKNGVLRVRERPGMMGHAVALGELAHDEIGISSEFAGMLLHQNKRRLQDLAPTIWRLDGFPCWGIRFPVANEFGIQPRVLRILRGRGQFIGFNPWSLSKHYLGDCDGDLGFCLLRCSDVLDGRAFIERRKRLSVTSDITAIRNPLTLQNVLDPSLLPIEPKLQDKMRQVDLTTQEKRLGFIQDADTRTFVAVLTMIFAWWVPRVLATSGGLGPHEAYIQGHRALEWFIETAMDGRKEGSPFLTPGFNAYQFLDVLMQGGDLNFEQLEKIGAPAHAIDTLRAAWIISSGNLRAVCAKSPVYNALVLRRRQMNQSSVDMLDALQRLGVKPEELYETILRDLTCIETLSAPPSGYSAASSEDAWDLDDQ